MRAIIAVLIFMFSSAHAGADLAGSYTGCGNMTTGPQQIYFHLVKSPIGFDANHFKYTGAFILGKGNVGTFFPEVQLNEDQSKLLMTVEIPPRHDFGMIVKTIYVEVQSDGSLVGRYVSNAAIAGDVIADGLWSAKKVPNQSPIVKLNCQKN